MTRKQGKNERNEKNKMSISLAIKELNLSSDDVVFIHKYSTSMKEDKKYTVEELLLDTELLKKKIMLVNKNYGGVEYNYSAWLFIIK